jgi:hypothetical protein
MSIVDVEWAVISLIELSKRLKTFLQLELFIDLTEKELHTLHASILDRNKDTEITYYQNFLIVRLFPDSSVEGVNQK